MEVSQLASERKLVLMANKSGEFIECINLKKLNNLFYANLKNLGKCLKKCVKYHKNFYNL